MSSSPPLSCVVTAVPVKSANDDREYRCIRLSNNLEAILVSDPTVEKAAACMNVGVGHMEDPPEIPGLAHFLEHMLFLGSEPYPNETEYKAFVLSHGGRTNASTSTENTDYKFDVAAEYLGDVLDRFAQFFISPLFTESATEREMNAVDSEFVKNLQNDSRREYMLIKTLSDRTTHKFFKFGTGNLRTLRDDPKELGLSVRQHLIDFHKTHYSANRMRLAVLGRDSLDTLQEWVVSKFSAIPDKGLPGYKYEGSPWSDRTCRVQTAVCSVKDIRELRISWPMPSAEPLYKEKPHEYLSHLLGHEGKGSILAKLKYLQLANSLSSGLRISLSNAALFTVHISLTEEGQRCPYDVLDTVFRYIDEVRTVGPQESVFRERQLVDDLNFRFKEKYGSFEYVIDLASDLAQYGAEDVLTGGAVRSVYSPALIQQCIDCLTPDKAMVIMMSRAFDGKTDTLEKHYSTPYATTGIAPEVLAFWRGGPPPPQEALWLTRHMEPCPKPVGFVRSEGPALALPAPNPYIPENFDLKAREDAPTCPILLEERAGGVLWFKHDDTFKQAKAAVYVRLITAKENLNARDLVLSKLLAMLLEDALNEETYDATLAGLGYSIDLADQGWSLYVRGYDHKLGILLNTVLQRLRSFEPDTKRFDAIKERLQRSYANFRFMRVDEHAYSYQCWLLENFTFPLEERAKCLEALTRDDVAAYALRHLAALYTEVFIHGNLRAEHAKDVFETVLGALKTEPLAAERRPTLLYSELKPGTPYVFRKAGLDTNELQTCVRNYYQMGHMDARGRALLALLAQMIKAPCFAQLRTKEQLAYVVSTLSTHSRGIDGFIVTVISKVMSPHLVDARIEAFLSGYTETIAKMTPEDFKTQVEALAIKILEKDKRLFDETDRLWREIKDHTYNWARQEETVKALRALTLEDVLKFYTETMIDPATRRKMSLQVFGKELPIVPDSEEGVVFAHQQDYESFRNSCTLYPCFI